MKSKSIVSTIVRDYIMYIVLVVLIIISTIIADNFLSVANLINIVRQNVSYLVAGVGITFIMLSGAMDLSVGYQISTVSVVVGVMARNGVNGVLIIILAIVLAALLSMVNGAIYARLKIFPFMITLATQYILYGTSYLISNSKTIRDLGDTVTFLGGYRFTIGSTQFPVSIIVMIVAVAIGAFILNKTYFGRNVYALGSNPDAVALSGVSVAKMRVLVFGLAGAFFGLAAILIAGRTGTVSSASGVSYEFTVMAGAMLGGVKMGGGGGKMNNMVVGILIIGLINNVMTLMNLNTYVQNIALGVVLLLAITIDTLQTESIERRAKQVAGQQADLELEEKAQQSEGK